MELCESSVKSSAHATFQPVRRGDKPAGSQNIESASASSMNFFTLVVYKARQHHKASPKLAALWVGAGISLALLEVSVIYALIFNYLSPSCLTNDDCDIGTTCSGRSSRFSMSFCFE
jgi:hypothetical protein